MGNEDARSPSCRDSRPAGRVAALHRFDPCVRLPDFDCSSRQRPEVGRVARVRRAVHRRSSRRVTRELTPGLACAHTARFASGDGAPSSRHRRRRRGRSRLGFELVSGFLVRSRRGLRSRHDLPARARDRGGGVVERSVGFNKVSSADFRDDRFAGSGARDPSSVHRGRFRFGARTWRSARWLRAVGGFDAALGTGTRCAGGRPRGFLRHRRRGVTRSCTNGPHRLPRAPPRRRGVGAPGLRLRRGAHGVISPRRSPSGRRASRSRCACVRAGMRSRFDRDSERTPGGPTTIRRTWSGRAAGHDRRPALYWASRVATGESVVGGERARRPRRPRIGGGAE